MGRIGAGLLGGRKPSPRSVRPQEPREPGDPPGEEGHRRDREDEREGVRVAREPGEEAERRIDGNQRGPVDQVPPPAGPVGAGPGAVPASRGVALPRFGGGSRTRSSGTPPARPRRSAAPRPRRAPRLRVQPLKFPRLEPEGLPRGFRFLVHDGRRSPSLGITGPGTKV